MFILLYLSKEQNEFENYKNCIQPLIDNKKLAIIKCDKDKEIDYNNIKEQITDICSKYNESWYNFIVVEDLSDQKKNPLVYSISAIMHQLKEINIDNVRNKNNYFILFDKIVRDINHEPSDINIKKCIEFDKNGYIKNSNENIYLNEKDFSFENDIDSFFNNDKRENKKEIYEDFYTQKVKPIKNRILQAIDNEKGINLTWYKKCVENSFDNYYKLFNNFTDVMAKGDVAIEERKFDLKNCVKNNISTYDNDLQAKIITINLTKRDSSVTEEQETCLNYYKIISLINLLVCCDDNTLFPDVVANKEAIYYDVDIDINKERVNSMLINYYQGIKKQIENKQNGDTDIIYNTYSYNKNNNSNRNLENCNINSPKLFGLCINSKKDKNIVNNYFDTIKNNYTKFENILKNRLEDETKILKNKDKTFYNNNTEKIKCYKLLEKIEEYKTEIDSLKDEARKNVPQYDIDSLKKDYNEIGEIEGELVCEVENRDKIIKVLLRTAFPILIVIFIAFIFKKFSIPYYEIINILLIISIIHLIFNIILCFLKQHRISKLNTQIKEKMDTMKEKINGDDFKTYLDIITELMLKSHTLNQLKEQENKHNIEIKQFSEEIDLLEKIQQDNAIVLKKFNIREENLNNNIEGKNIVDDNVNKYERCPLFYANNQNNQVDIKLGMTEVEVEDHDLLKHIKLVDKISFKKRNN